MKTVTLILTVQVFYRKVLLKYGKCSRMLQSRTPYLAESYLEIGCQGNQIFSDGAFFKKKFWKLFFTNI